MLTTPLLAADKAAAAGNGIGPGVGASVKHKDPAPSDAAGNSVYACERRRAYELAAVAVAAVGETTAAGNGIGAGDGASGKHKEPAPGDAAAKANNIFARERLRAHELASPFGNRLGAGEKHKEPAPGDAAAKANNIFARERLRAHELASPSGNRLGAGEKLTWGLMHEGRRARELAAAASALAQEVRGSDLAVFVGPAKLVATSAASYAESLRDDETANNLELALAEFNNLFDTRRPKNQSTNFQEVRRKSSQVLRQYRCRPSEKLKPSTEPKHNARDGNPNAATKAKNHADSRALHIAEVAELLAVQLGREAAGSALATTAQAFAQEAHILAQNPTDRSARALFLLTGRALLGAAKDEPPQFTASIQALLSDAEALGANPAPANPVPISDAVIGKRQILYALALGAPVSLLTSAAGMKLFPGDWAWVAGAGVAVWILATAGMIFNQFGQMRWEQIAGRHLSRFGVLGAVILISLYAYRTFFPHSLRALICLVVLGLVTVGIPWILSCFRPDDATTATTSDSDTVAADRIV